MVLPVAALPLLAIGGSAMLAPHVLNYRDRMQGKANRRAMEGVDQNDPRAQANALFGAGLIGGKDLLNHGTDQGRLGVSQGQLGVSQGRLGLEQDKWGHALATDSANKQAMSALAQATGMPEIFAGIPSLANDWVSKNAGATFTELNKTPEQREADALALEAQNAQNQSIVDVTPGATDLAIQRSSSESDQLAFSIEQQASLRDQWEAAAPGQPFPMTNSNTPDYQSASQALGSRGSAVADYKMAAQPLVDTQNEYGWAVENLGKGLQNHDYRTSPEGMQTRTRINQLTMKLKNDFFRKQLERGDAPGEIDTKELNEMFPMLSPTWTVTGGNEEKALAVIEQNFRIGAEQAGHSLTDLQTGLTNAGHAVPDVQPRNTLPNGWTRDGS